MCVDCWERVLIEIVDEDPAGPSDLPFHGPPAVLLVQEWVRLADALLAANPDLAIEIAALRIAAMAEHPVIETGTAEDLLQIATLPLDPLRDPLGQAAWLQRRAVVALYLRFGMAEALSNVHRIRPALVGYLAARAQLDGHDRESLARALAAEISRGRTPNPGEAGAIADWLTR
jgi:hypothetical protein